MTEDREVKLVAAPAGVEGAGFFATSLDKVVGLARSYSLWPLPLQPRAAVLNSWQPWDLIMILPDLGLKDQVFHHVRQIYLWLWEP